MTSKCGEHRIWHWAHQGTRHCDRWWEPETPWHRAWKSEFPAAWREVSHRAEDGERHIADLKTDGGRIVEFQHSPIAVNERASREIFYKSMVWVVDGLRRKRDRQSFGKTLYISNRTPLVYTGFASECALLRDWVGSPVDVFFDFGPDPEGIVSFGRPILWHLHPTDPGGKIQLMPIFTEGFIATIQKEGQFMRLSAERSITQTPALPVPTGLNRGRLPEGFLQYRLRQGRRRRRF